MAKPLDKKTVEKKTAKPGKKPGGMASNKRKSSSGGAGGGGLLFQPMKKQKASAGDAAEHTEQQPAKAEGTGKPGISK